MPQTVFASRLCAFTFFSLFTFTFHFSRFTFFHFSSETVFASRLFAFTFPQQRILLAGPVKVSVKSESFPKKLPTSLPSPSVPAFAASVTLALPLKETLALPQSCNTSAAHVLQRVASSSHRKGQKVLLKCKIEQKLPKPDLGNSVRLS